MLLVTLTQRFFAEKRFDIYLFILRFLRFLDADIVCACKQIPMKVREQTMAQTLLRFFLLL